MGVTPIYVNRVLSDDDRRQRAFDGAIFVHQALKGSEHIVEWARELVSDAFGAVSDVRNAHRELAVNDFVERAGPVKSRFTNDTRTKRLCQELISGVGCDPERTYFDLPRLRVIPPASYLSAGVSYNYAPHRDTWYAHPRQLINYWAPVFDTEQTMVMTMFVDYFGRPVENSSDHWDYDEWVKNARFKASSNIQKEERAHPLPSQNVLDSAGIRIVLNGGDVMMFSTCQLHASTPNETDQVRFSYDLRTINIDDLMNDRGPVNVDGRATGTTLQDFLRVSDLAPLQVEPRAA